MLPDFLVPEITVRECGESSIFNLDAPGRTALVLTLSITHATEQESLDLDIHESSDGVNWSLAPLASFKKKSYCGTYQMVVSQGRGPFVKAVWRVNRWSRSEARPFFRFYLFAQEARTRAVAGAA
jgi:hypothetical protein